MKGKQARPKHKFLLASFESGYSLYKCPKWAVGVANKWLTSSSTTDFVINCLFLEPIITSKMT